MKLIDCPHIGARPQSEFVFGGEVRLQPVPESTDDVDWADYVFNNDGEPGIRNEWWYHSSSGLWFVWQRNTLTDEFIRVLEQDQIKKLVGAHD